MRPKCNSSRCTTTSRAVEDVSGMVNGSDKAQDRWRYGTDCPACWSTGPHGKIFALAVGETGNGGNQGLKQVTPSQR